MLTASLCCSCHCPADLVCYAAQPAGMYETSLTIISACRRLRACLRCSRRCSCGRPILQAQQVHQSGCRGCRGHRLGSSRSRQGGHRSAGPTSRSEALGGSRGLAARICSVCSPVSTSCRWCGTCSSGLQQLHGIADADAGVRCRRSEVRHVLRTLTGSALPATSALPSCSKTGSPELAQFTWLTQAQRFEAYLCQRPPQTVS